MICVKCKNPLNVVEQLKEANEDYYEDISGPILLMIRCEHCDEQTAVLEISPTSGETEIIESPVGPVTFPKL